MDRSHNPFLYPITLPASLPAEIKATILALHAVALCLPWLSAVHVLIKFVLSMAVFGSAIHFICTGRQATPGTRIKNILLRSDDSLLLTFNDGSCQEGELSGYQYISSCLAILGVSYNGRNRYFLYTAGNLASEIFRRLRVRLIHRQNQAEQY